MNFLKQKITKLFIVSALSLTSSAVLITGLVVSSNKSDTNVSNNSTIITGDFSGTPESTNTIKVDYTLKGFPNDISHLNKIEYTFVPMGSGVDVTDIQSGSDLPPTFNDEYSYEVINNNFIPGTTYKGEAKIILKDGTISSVRKFTTEITMPAGIPTWNINESYVDAYISGAEIYASIDGLSESPVTVFDDSNFKVKISEKFSSNIILERNLSSLSWTNNLNNWYLTNPIEINDGLEENTDYKIEYYFNGDGSKLPSTYEEYYVDYFSTSPKEQTPNWSVTQIGLFDYEQAQINISSDSLFHQWHGSFIKNVQISEIKNISLNQEVDYNNYQHINNDLAKWNPTLSEQSYDKNWIIKNLKPESDYEGTLSVDYREDLVMDDKKKFNFIFSTKNKKTFPIFKIENQIPTQVLANKWQLDFDIVIQDGNSATDRDLGTYKDIKEFELLIYNNSFPIHTQIITSPSKISNITIGSINDPTKLFDADSLYKIEIVNIVTNVITQQPSEISELGNIPKNALFEKPLTTPSQDPQENNSMHFDLEWNLPFINYEENISKMYYSVDNQITWNEVDKTQSNNFTNLDINNLDPAQSYDVYLRVVPTDNTFSGPKNGDYIWNIYTDETDKNPAPQITILNSLIKATSIEFELNIIDYEYLTDIIIKTTDITNAGNNIADVVIDKSEILDENIILIIDESFGITDFNEYQFDIIFNVDETITWKPGENTEPGKENEITTSIGGIVNSNTWTSNVIKTYPKVMDVSNIIEINRSKTIDYGIIVELSFDITNIKGYEKSIYVIKDPRGNEVERIISTNPIIDATNDRIIGNLDIGYSIVIELYGKSTDASIKNSYMHDSEFIKI